MKVEDVLINKSQKWKHLWLVPKVILVLTEQRYVLADALICIHQSVKRFMKSVRHLA
jgi:hypothetical protein